MSDHTVEGTVGEEDEQGTRFSRKVVGEDMDIEWDEVEFKKIDYDEDDKDAAGPFNVELHVTYKKDTYVIMLNVIETNLGILMTRPAYWRGEKGGSSKYDSGRPPSRY